MSVTVRLYAGARAAAGTGEVQVAAGEVQGVLAELTERFEALARVLPACTLLVDGERVEAPARLADHAVLEVLPPFAGG